VVKLAVEEFFEEQAGEALGVVADDAMFFEEIIEDDAEAEFLELRQIDGYRLGTLCTVAAGDIGRDGLTVGDDPVNDAVRNVLLDGPKMVAESVARGFAGLGHQVGDIDAGRFGLGNGAGDFRDQQIRQNAGVKRAGAEKNEVGLLDGVNGAREGAHTAGRKAELPDGIVAGGNARFAVNDAVVFERGDKMHIRKRGGKDAAANRKYLAADADGFREIPGNVGKRGEKQIAEIVATEAAASVETILKETAKERFVLRKSNHAIANVAGRENAIFAAQAAGASSVVGDGNDSGEVGDGALDAGVLFAAAEDVLFQAAEKRGKTGAAAERNDPEAGKAGFRIGGALFHVECRGDRTGFTLQRRI